MKPRVVVIATGGTISGLSVDTMDVFNYGSDGRFMKGDELVTRVVELERYAEVEVVPFENVASPAIGPRHWLDIIAIIHSMAAKDPGIAGFVITHGTASLEETVYFLNLTLKVECPVVVVGAQRPASALGSDAALNLVSAVRVAGDKAARGMGALVVFNGEINAAREVSKTSTFRSQTFQSQDLGLLGYMDGDEVTFYRSPLRRHYPDTEFDVTGLTELPRVDIVPCYSGADGIFIEAAMAAGCAGIVIASMAPGSVTPWQTDAIAKAHAQGIVVVMSSRAGSGRITGARHAITDIGMIPGDTLTPQKARLLLMLALTRTRDPARITEMFRTY